MEESELTALMGRYCDGDEAAFRALYAAIAARLVSYAMTMVLDRATAEDAVQQTFLKLHHGRSTYRRGALPLPWIYTITHRICLDEIRRRKRSRIDLVAEPPELRADITGALESDRVPAAQSELTGLTLKALDTLPVSQREALVLTKLHGRSLAEAAAITGSTPGAIKLRAHRAYVALRKLVPGKPQ